MSFMEKLFGNFSDKELKRIKPIANKVLSPKCRNLLTKNYRPKPRT